MRMITAELSVKVTYDSNLDPEYTVDGTWYVGNIEWDVDTLRNMGLSSRMYGQIDCSGTLEDSTGNGCAASDLKDFL